VCQNAILIQIDWLGIEVQKIMEISPLIKVLIENSFLFIFCLSQWGFFIKEERT